MRKYLFLLLFIPFLITSCYRENIPEATFDESLVLPRDTMEMVLLDLHLMEGAWLQEKREDARANILPNKYFQVILEKYHITREEFDESMRYYTYHIDEMDEMFEHVINDLGKKESELNVGE